MSVCLKFSVGAAGSAGDRTMYDTKERATLGDPNRVWTQNVPEWVEDRDHYVNYKELRLNLVEYARQMEEDELERPHEGKGDTRTYYREIYSFHEDVSDEKAISMVDEHQRENFPDSPIINSLHRNASHVHVHSIIFARQTDGKKLQLGWKSYHQIDESWAKIYGREFGEHLAREHLEKKVERLKHRKVAREAKLKGEKPPPRPERVTHERNQLEERKQIALRDRGVRPHDESRTGRNQRSATTGDRRPRRAGEGERVRERPAARADRDTGRAAQSIEHGEAGLTRERSDLSAAAPDHAVRRPGSQKATRRVKADRAEQVERGRAGDGGGARGDAGPNRREGPGATGKEFRDHEDEERGAPSRDPGRGLPETGHGSGAHAARVTTGEGQGSGAREGHGSQLQTGGGRERETAHRITVPGMGGSFGNDGPKPGLLDHAPVGSGHNNPTTSLDHRIDLALKPLHDQKEKEREREFERDLKSFERLEQVETLQSPVKEKDLVKDMEKVIGPIFER